MSTVWKVLVAAAALVLLPLSAYAVGSLTAPAERPTPRHDIEMTDESPTSPPASSGSPARSDDDVRVVRPAPSQVPPDSGRPARGGNNGGNNLGDDDADDGPDDVDNGGRDDDGDDVDDEGDDDGDD